jgi:hypothetical protein
MRAAQNPQLQPASNFLLTFSTAAHFIAEDGH